MVSTPKHLTFQKEAALLAPQRFKRLLLTETGPSLALASQCVKLGGHTLHNCAAKLKQYRIKSTSSAANQQGQPLSCGFLATAQSLPACDYHRSASPLRFFTDGYQRTFSTPSDTNTSRLPPPTSSSPPPLHCINMQPQLLPQTPPPSNWAPRLISLMPTAAEAKPWRERSGFSILSDHVPWRDQEAEQSPDPV